MNTFTTFILGLISGWVIEWIIDWVYWRRPKAEPTRAPQPTDLRNSNRMNSDLEAQLSRLKMDNMALQDKVKALEAKNMTLTTPADNTPAMSFTAPGMTPATPVVAPESFAGPTSFGVIDENSPQRGAGIAVPQQMDSTPAKPDDLIVIKGIGPVIAKKLNNAGIFTFKQLAAITPVQLREIVGDVIQRLADEDEILNQAKKLAAGQDQASNS
ncbi:MAG TPA: helix-hairpin-helix domain-containing protein [Anaerolineales bacterium]